MKSASLTAGLLVSKGAATPSLPREILDPANYADISTVRMPQAAKAPNADAKPLVRPVVKVKTTQGAPEAPQKAKAAIKVNDNSPRISTTVRLSGDIHKRLRLLAARDRVNLQVLLEQATAELLTRELGEDDCVCTSDK